MEWEFIMKKKGMFEGFEMEKYNKLYEEEVENKYGKVMLIMSQRKKQVNIQKKTGII